MRVVKRIELDDVMTHQLKVTEVPVRIVKQWLPVVKDK